MPECLPPALLFVQMPVQKTILRNLRSLKKSSFYFIFCNQRSDNMLCNFLSLLRAGIDPCGIMDAAIDAADGSLLCGLRERLKMAPHPDVLLVAGIFKREGTIQFCEHG